MEGISTAQESVSDREKYTKLLVDYLPEDQETKELILSFFENFPKLPKDPTEAFTTIQKHLIDSGFKYENTTFMLEDMIREKKGNCLGLGVMFGTVLLAQDFDPKYEIAVNPQDEHYRNDLKQFDKLVHGEVFPYDNLPDLPNHKAEVLDNWFTPLEHPILTMGGKQYETTTLLAAEDYSEDSGIGHEFKSESRRPVSYRNLIGALFTSKAKIDVIEANTPIGYDELMSSLKKGLQLWPEDRQSWLMARGLAISNFDDVLAVEAEEKFRSLSGDDSLSNFSLYEITEDEKLLDKALAKYPAYIDAFLAKNIKLPLKTQDEKKEAKFNFTVGSVCVANSTEIDLDLFYLRNITIITEAFGEEYAAELLYDLELDEKRPAQYYLAMYRVRQDPDFLIKAVTSGALEESMPMDDLYLCDSVLKETVEDKSLEAEEIRVKCKAELEKLKEKYKDSAIFMQELNNL